MLAEISKKNKRLIKQIMKNMTLREKAAQVLCWDIRKELISEIKSIAEKAPIGSVYLQYDSPERYVEVAEALEEVSEIPVIISSDLDYGAGARIKGCMLFPWQMAMGAADSEELVEQAARATAKEGRYYKVHWTFAPVVDLNLNHNNPITNIRAFGEKPGHVLKHSKAFIRGMQEDGMMAACCKHFPGDGLDDRDQHLCTSINPLGREEWESTYGKVWRGVINEGVMSILPGHIALPFIDPGTKEYLGPAPATLSKKIQIDFLRNELGFKGLIISDAIPMVGYCAHVSDDMRVVSNIKAGSDMALFTDPIKDTRRIMDAVKNGFLPEERLDEALEKVLELKARVKLFDEMKLEKMDGEEKAAYWQCGEEIGRRSVSIIRNEGNLIPLSLKKGAKVWTVSIMYYKESNFKNWDLKVVDEELRDRGLMVDHSVNPSHREIIERMNNYDAVFLNINIIPHDNMGTIRLTGGLAMAFWRAFWMDHPCVVFTSFGDPYKIYELSSLPNMINTYSPMPASQRAAVKVWLGEEKTLGKNPVGLKGFFDIGV